LRALVRLKLSPRASRGSRESLLRSQRGRRRGSSVRHRGTPPAGCEDGGEPSGGPSPWKAGCCAYRAAAGQGMSNPASHSTSHRGHAAGRPSSRRSRKAAANPAHRRRRCVRSSWRQGTSWARIASASASREGAKRSQPRTSVDCTVWIPRACDRRRRDRSWREERTARSGSVGETEPRPCRPPSARPALTQQPSVGCIEQQ